MAPMDENEESNTKNTEGGTCCMVFRVLIILIAISMSIYQFVVLTSDYLKYDVNIDIKIEIPDKLKIPGITISVEMLSLINYDVLVEKYPYVGLRFLELHNVSDFDSFTEFIKIENKTKAFLEPYIAANLTVQQLFDVIYPIGEFARIHELVLPETSDTKEDPICNQIEYIKNGRIWFAYWCLEENRNLIRTKDLAENYITYLELLRINHKLFNRIDFVNLYLHPPGEIIRNWRRVSAKIPPTENPGMRYVSYQRFETHLLAAPYNTDCRNYTDEGFMSRFHKIEDCEDREARRSLKIKFPENTRFRNDTSLVGSYETDRQHLKSARKIWDKCETEIKHEDCHVEYFMPNVHPAVEYDSGNYSYIAIRASLEPEIVKKAKVKTNLANYLTLVCSIFNFWFGFSVAGTVIALIPMLHKKGLEHVKCLPLEKPSGGKGEENESGEGPQADYYGPSNV